VTTPRIARWFDDRLRASSYAHRALTKVFPDDWSFMLGEIALYSFVVLVATGTFLAFFYSPSLSEVVYRGPYAPLRGLRVSEAYASTLRVSFEVRAGLVFRQTHHWAANVFVAAIVAHLVRVFFTGAFRRPRELNWIIGVTLLVLTLYEGFAGYSLPDDLLSGTGLRVAYSVFLSVPFVGTWMAFLLFGGEFPAHDILRRLLITHVFVVPAIMGGLLAAHLALIWHQKHTQFAGRGRTETNVVGSKLWPTYAAKSVGLFFAVAAVVAALGGLVQVNPVWLYGPFRPFTVSSPAQPDWYLGWLEGALRIFPPWEIRAFGHTIANPFLPAVLLPTVTFGLLYVWPFLERRLTRDRAEHHLLNRVREHPVRTALGTTALTFYGVLLMAASNDLIAKEFAVSVEAVTWVFRVLALALPLAVGAVTLRWMHAWNRSGVDHFLEVPASAFRRRRRERGAA
jgi:ubiquinol-cytochrome c reductase cytochrome b subunit